MLYKDRHKHTDAHDHYTEDVPGHPEPLHVYNQPNWYVQFDHENDTEDIPEG